MFLIPGEKKSHVALLSICVKNFSIKLKILNFIQYYFMERIFIIITMQIL